MNTAVILAAGLGSRLGGLTELKPKGFLEIDGISLIERSIHNLVDAGISRILIGTGYRHEFYDALASHYPVETIQNDRYEMTGSMFTLYNLWEHLEEDFLLLESDLLYDPSGLNILISSGRSDIILAAGWTYSGDEVYIETDTYGNLVAMSKNPEALRHADAELIGISKISLPTYQAICTWASRNLGENSRLDYEYSLVGIAQQIAIQVLKINDYVWCEIDDQHHLQRALYKIYPLIRERIL